MQKFILLSLLSLFMGDLTSANAAFRKIPVSRTEPCSFRLSGMETIPHHCIRWVDETAKLPVWQGSLGFELGHLSHGQWQKLTKIYGAWHNASLLPPYNSQRNYDLLDFMPPTLQALDRHRFYAQEQRVAGRTLGVQEPLTKIQLVTNCWGTVYEVLRLAHRPKVESPILFVTAAQPMLETLRQVSTPADAEKPGDILLISHRHGDREYLDHTVLVIDRNLYFEKAGTGDEVPYRFVASDTLRQIWNPAIFRYELRRPLPDKPLPPPGDRFSLKQQSVLGRSLRKDGWTLGAKLSHFTAVEDPDTPTILLWIQPLPPLQNIRGRFQLPATAYGANTLWPRHP
jgi:hypothetical protein